MKEFLEAVINNARADSMYNADTALDAFNAKFYYSPRIFIRITKDYVDSSIKEYPDFYKTGEIYELIDPRQEDFFVILKKDNKTRSIYEFTLDEISERI